MADVFVSYKAEDRRRVKPLVEALEMDGYSVWWDEQIGGGTAWRHSIEAELNAAKCVIVAWSKRSVQPEGAFVQDEATRAQQRHVYVPVLIDKVHLPLGFGETQALPLAGWKGNKADPHYEAVLAAVRRNVGGKRRASTSPLPRPNVDRRTMIVGSTAAAVAIAGAGAWAFLKPGSASAAGDSVAVLPFENLSGNPAQAYFSDGIAEEIRSALARIGGLQVVGRTSSEAVRNDDAATAAKKLGVANILTGSVRQSASTIRINAELIDGRSGIDRWSQGYDRSPGDAIKIQTDIAENVASALSIALGTAVRAALTAGGTKNVSAHNLALQANQWTYEYSLRGYQRARELIDAAIQLDPNYGYAYGLKAIILNSFANEYAHSANELAQGRDEAWRNAQKAVTIAPNLPIAHGALAEIYRGNLQIRAALPEYKRALALAPSTPDALRAYASVLVRIGQPDEAVRLVSQALALDPLNSASYGNRAAVLFNAHRYADAARDADDLTRRSPDLFDYPITLANSLMMLGRTKEAKDLYARSERDNPFRLAGEAVLAARTGDRSGALQTMARLQQIYGEGATYQYAEIHAQLGEIDAAFASLDRAWQIKDGGLLALGIDPWVDPLRADSRFKPLLAKLDLPIT